MRSALSLSAAALAVALGAFLLYRSLGRYDFDELTAMVLAVSPLRLALASAFAAASYLCLTGFDWLALRYAGRPLPYRRAALASFTSLSLGHNIGFAALSSGAIRYRFYSRWGLTAFEVGKVIVFCGATVGLGLATLGGLATLVQPRLTGEVIGVGTRGAVALGIACLTLPAAYAAMAAAGLGRLRLGKWSIALPTLRLALAQILLGTANFTMVAACLHQTLLALGDVPYAATAAVYVIANAATLVSHVPGGVGVVESTVLFLLPDRSFIGAVLMFRLTYFLVPLCAGLLSLLLSELTWGRAQRHWAP